MTQIDLTRLPRPVVHLVGEDGNAYAIIGRVHRAMRRAGWTEEAIRAFDDEAMAGNYDVLLATTLEYCDEASDVKKEDEEQT